MTRKKPKPKEKKKEKKKEKPEKAGRRGNTNRTKTVGKCVSCLTRKIINRDGVCKKCRKGK